MVVFFFKQKTAYEMRISDWSSDVCSSDLQKATARNSRSPVSVPPPNVMRLTLLLMTRNTPANDRATPAQADTLSRWPRNDEISRAKIGATETRMAPLEIGRAACRERVGTYV